MFYSWKEFCTSLYITRFELLITLVSLLISSALFTVKLAAEEQSVVLLSWWTVASPLFVLDLFDGYFVTIVFIRQLQTSTFRTAAFRAFFSLKRVLLLSGFKFLLCKRLEGELMANYSEVFLPLFYGLFMLVCRAFRLVN